MMMMVRNRCSSLRSCTAFDHRRTREWEPRSCEAIYWSAERFVWVTMCSNMSLEIRREKYSSGLFPPTSAEHPGWRVYSGIDSNWSFSSILDVPLAPISIVAPTSKFFPPSRYVLSHPNLHFPLLSPLSLVSV